MTRSGLQLLPGLAARRSSRWRSSMQRVHACADRGRHAPFPFLERLRYEAYCSCLCGRADPAPHALPPRPPPSARRYDIKAPSMFNTRNVGKTLVTRTQGTKVSPVARPLGAPESANEEETTVLQTQEARQTAWILPPTGKARLARLHRLNLWPGRLRSREQHTCTGWHPLGLSALVSPCLCRRLPLMA